MADTEAPARRALAAADIPALMDLVAEVGWNQTEADWDRMLRIGTGVGHADGSDRIVASAVVLPYGPGLGWIGMVLVTAAWRRQGLATGLMRWAVDTLTGAGRVPGLDATPAGEAVYRAMGFEGGLEITRWRREAWTPGTPGAEGVSALRPGDLGWVAELDEAAFGAPRRDLLREMLAAEGAGWSAGGRGFLLRRAGRTATQLGPLCAENDVVAERLIGVALAVEPGPLLVDVPDRHGALATRLSETGFAAERPFRRMYLGEPVPAGDPAFLYALAGPELG